MKLLQPLLSVIECPLWLGGELEAVDRENNKSVFIAQGLCQSSRMDYVIQNLLNWEPAGCSDVMERCQVQHGNRSYLEKKFERWKLSPSMQASNAGATSLQKFCFPKI